MPAFIGYPLAAIALLVGLVCWVIILVEAFKDAVWKGLLFFLCGLYALYYGIFEYESDRKWETVIMAFGGTAIGTGILRLIS